MFGLLKSVFSFIPIFAPEISPRAKDKMTDAKFIILERKKNDDVRLLGY